MAAKVNIKLVVLIRKKETPREKVVKNDAMIVRFFSPIKIKPVSYTHLRAHETV